LHFQSNIIIDLISSNYIASFFRLKRLNNTFLRWLQIK